MVDQTAGFDLEKLRINMKTLADQGDHIDSLTFVESLESII